MRYYRPIACVDAAPPPGALRLAGGWAWFTHAEVLTRDGPCGHVAACEIPEDVLARLTASRPALAGLSLDRPRVMGVVNVTPDSFSDGGLFATTETALQQGEALVAAGSDLLDIGGESTRPGAIEVSEEDEVARVIPVIEAIRWTGSAVPISVDTRKSSVASAALTAGADIVNDVSAFTFDPALAGVVARSGAPVVLMHAQGTPATMQTDPRYDDVLLDVYDWLAERAVVAEAAGIARDRIVIDPGIGFGKTTAHNLALIRGLSIFHGLGCPILLGASRKRFIGEIGNAPDAQSRGPGTIAITIAGLSQGVQIHRVHDIAATGQALRLWQAATGTDAG
jgi:dihydropteroate synthase